MKTIDPITLPKAKRTRDKKPLTYALVEVVADGDDGKFIFIPLPVPEGTDMSGKAQILRSVTSAAAKGDEQYDGKKITVISYPKPLVFKAEPIVLKRKISFNL
jgi:hypothetical protein